MDAVGLHLAQAMAAGASPRSAVAVVDSSGALTSLGLVADDDEVVAAVAPGAPVVVADAPLTAPEDAGIRDAERVLSWCDVTAFPVSRRRLERVYGGARGVDLRPRLDAPGRLLAETLPDLVLRQLAWERAHPPGEEPLPLEEYRTAWIGVRAPRYRPRGGGRGRPDGLRAAWDLLSGVLDLGGWFPSAEGATGVVEDAARVDALCCAYAALRATAADGRHAVAIGTPERGLVVAPADSNLAARVELHLRRLRDEGAVAI